MPASFRTTSLNLLHKILEVDRPIPPRTSAELTEEIEQHYPWNFTVTLLDICLFIFGGSFISTSTVLPLFVSKLTDSLLAIGLVAIIGQAAWPLPQLFTANWVEGLPRKKPVVVKLGFFLERLAVVGMALTPLLALRSPTLALTLFLLSFAWKNLGAGTVATAWQDLIARIFPVKRRGRFFGVSIFVGTAAGLVGAGWSARLLETVPYPQNFFFSFSLAALFTIISWFFLSLIREPAYPPNAHTQTSREFWRALPVILRQDHNFRRFLIVRLVMTLGGLGSGFFTVAALHTWQVSDGMVGLYTGVLLGGQMVGNLLFGFLGDRYGHKRNLVYSLIAASISLGLAWWSPIPATYLAVFALHGVTASSVMISGMLMVMEFCTEERRPTYLGLTNTAVGIIGVLAPLLGALLAQWGYALLFAIGLLFNVLALGLMLWWVKEPRQA